MTSLYSKLINVECKFTQYYSPGGRLFYLGLSKTVCQQTRSRFQSLVVLNGVAVMHQLASERGYAGLEIATDMVTNATNILSLATKNSGLVATLDTRFLSELDLNYM